MHKKLTFIWFLLGIGYRLQVVASLSITEILVLVTAPFIFCKTHHEMKRDGVMPFFILSVLVIIGCIIGSIENHTYWQFVLRGLAVTCIISCSIIFSHWILSRDPGGFKWFILGLPISLILSTYIFKSAVEVGMCGDTVEEIMEGPLFWISRLQPLLLAPVKGWYLQTPMVISVFAPLLFSVFSLIITTSGRSAAVAAIGFAALVLLGGKTRKSINRISRYFWIICILSFLGIGGVYTIYKVSASQGWLGDTARIKYESQSDGGHGGLGRLILGGRGSSFIGLLACRDKPIIGWGPWPIDRDGYTEEFIRRFGTVEDIMALQRQYKDAAKYGFVERRLGCHAYITQFWAWYGIWGLIFWLYVMFVMLRYLKQDVAAIPQWYAWLACSIPGVFGGIFFSPLSDRFGIPLLITACLMARAVRKGILALPNEMIMEIYRTESKR